MTVSEKIRNDKRFRLVAETKLSGNDKPILYLSSCFPFCDALELGRILRECLTVDGDFTVTSMVSTRGPHGMVIVGCVGKLNPHEKVTIYGFLVARDAEEACHHPA